jgi:hypothetical protein
MSVNSICYTLFLNVNKKINKKIIVLLKNYIFDKIINLKNRKMNSKQKIEKYESALKIILFLVEYNPKVNFTKLRKELKINKNVFRSLSKLGIIKNNGTRKGSHYVLIKKFSPEMTLEVLNYANQISLNKKQSIIEKHIGIIEAEKPQPVKELNLFQKIIKILFNGHI